MWRVNLTDIFGITMGTIAGIAFFALIAYVVYLFVFKRVQMSHELRLEAVRQGRELPRDFYGSLKAGIITLAIGLAILAGILFNAFEEDRFPGAEIMLALAPLFVGLGLIFFYAIWGRQTRNINRPLD